ncbi:MAG TPA: pyruvate kinase, partial [Roseiarcus sp.]|nr:pyruvate kinase [Roseiarcus sp.]
MQALREDVEKKGAELRAEWGGAAERAGSRAANLSHYIALRGYDLTELQLRLATRGLSSLGRSEAKVIETLEALIVTLRRVTGETNVHYPARPLARAGPSELEAESERIFGKRPRGAPRVRVMATLPSEAVTHPELADNLIAAGMDCARINCAHDDVEAWGRMVAN